MEACSGCLSAALTTVCIDHISDNVSFRPLSPSPSSSTDRWKACHRVLADQYTPGRVHDKNSVRSQSAIPGQQPHVNLHLQTDSDAVCSLYITRCKKPAFTSLTGTTFDLSDYCLSFDKTVEITSHERFPIHA